MSLDVQETPAGAVKAALAELGPVFGERLLTSAAARAHYGAAESWLPAAPPDAVLLLHDTAEVSQALAICHRHGAPVIPFGAGSSIEGQVLAPEGGITLDLSAMDRVLAIHPEDMDCTVQCGTTRQRLNEELRDCGLFFPVDLGAHATLGGMASTRASGTTTVRYGSMRELVLGLTVVLPDGQVIRTGGRARKSASGYDLTHLFIGAEGTLGVITELTLRLFGIPAAAQSLLCSFADLDAATGCVVEALQFGLGLSRIELADDLQMHAINAYSGTDLPESPTLWVEITGSDPAVAHDIALFRDLAESAGASRIELAQTPEDAAKLWRIRHDALYATRALRPGVTGLSTDVCVPLSRLPECIAAIKAEIAETELVAPLVGHVGDGNFHLVLLFDASDPAELALGKRISARLVELALAMEGTATGEHGVGLGKKDYMAAEHGPALELMRRLKLAVDPRGIMNPGKIFDLQRQAMSQDTSLIRPEIAALADYNAGLALDRFRADYGVEARAKLDSNENPLGPAPAAIAAMRDCAAGIWRYPDAADLALREAIGAATGIDSEAVIVGNGSEDLIGAIYRAVLRPGDRVVTICPSFGLHEFGAQAFGARVEKVRFAEDWSFPLPGLVEALRQPARVLIFSSPSNPAGPAVSLEEFSALMEAVSQGTLVVFDEAYREYLDPALAFDPCAIMREAGLDWISLRTFSKAYSLAGARVGYGLCSSPALMRALRKTRNPFAVNGFGGAAALAALQDGAHLARTVALARSERARLSGALAATGYAVVPSQANFLFFRTPCPAADFVETLRRRGVLIKGWQESPFLDWARITIATPVENDAFLEALP